MDEKEELLKKDRERQKKREALREKREQELKKKVRLFTGIGILVFLILTAGISLGVHNHKKAEAEKKKEKARQEKLEKKKAQEDLTVEFLAVGDNIAHSPIYKSGKGEGDVWKEKNMYGKKTMGVVRTTYLIDEQGIIVKTFGKVKAADNPAQMLGEL